MVKQRVTMFVLDRNRLLFSGELFIQVVAVWIAVVSSNIVAEGTSTSFLEIGSGCSRPQFQIEWFETASAYQTRVEEADFIST